VQGRGAVLEPYPIVIDDDILSVQRRLRRRLFEGETAIRWRPGRELAAQLLLYLDDPQACWRITADWLRETLDADRVDGGFGGYIGPGGRVLDYVVMAEVQRPSLALPSVLGLRFSAVDPALRAVWGDEDGVAAIADVSQERSFTERMRGALISVGTHAKLALPVRDDALQPLGIICADWHRETPRWNAATCNELAGLSQSTLGPVLATAAQLASQRCDREQPDEPHDAAPPEALRQLTSAELKVARLVAMGLSYKEVARQIGRSLSTVDHQLRSIRDKLGVSSTSRLVRLLNVQFERLPPESS
jgi:DNA-binding CsgD family transcriptional regulator